MIFAEDRLYGWGASNIAMPRTAVELYPDRLRRTGEISCHDRRGATYRWRSSSISKIFLDDYPWGKALLLGMLATIMLAYIYLFDSTLSTDQNEPFNRPVEIVVALQKDEPRKVIYPVEEKSLESLELEQGEQQVMTESVTEEPDKRSPDEPKEKKQEVYKESQRRVPELPLPVVRGKQRFVRKKAMENKIIASTAPLMEKRADRKKITLSPPAAQQRSYRGKDNIELSQPSQALAAADFSSKKNNKSTENLIDTGHLQRRYSNKRQTDPKSETSQLNTTTELFTVNRSDKTAQLTTPATHLANQHYGSETKTLPSAAQTAPLGKDRQVSFQSQSRQEVVGIEPQKRARPFAKQSSSSLIASEATEPAISFKAARPPIKHSGAAVSKTRKSKKRYVFEKTNPYRTQAPQSANQELSFQSQKREENPKLTPPGSVKLLAKKTRSDEKSSSSVAKAHDFSHSVALDEIDPSELISLKEFNVCKDPEMEFRQKTQLAVHFHKASRIVVEGVQFFIKYTESGYTIEIDIYNPKGRPFRDRCEVLQLAIKSIVNPAN